MPNRLALEASPYLLQHADNPVDWYPWGEEAFALARELDKPILLSVGYAACHWCHVMAHESFEDPHTAALMNEHFVNVKVDREERPDVDSIYMNAVVALTGQGGWPMTVVMAADGTPFFGGTYFPPAPRHGMPSFRQVLLSIVQAWQTRRQDIQESATQITSQLRQIAHGATSTGVQLDRGMLVEAVANVQRQYDPINGGFGRAPKFPQAMTIEFLLRAHIGGGDARLLQMAEHTLEKMARGGMYDQIGGGFARYSTDDRWLVPHFEKMLYDNALLSMAYLHAWRVTRRPLYRRIVEETLDWALIEMRHEFGGFYSSLDADSEGEEGKFYVWHENEIDEALGTEAPLFKRFFGVTPHGNWEGHNILHQAGVLLHVATEFGLTAEQVRSSLGQSRSTLYAKRARREWPGLDKKILTAWNGLMLASFAEAGRDLQRPDYLNAAVTNAKFLWEHLRQKNGRLLRSWTESHGAKLNAYLEDYAYLAQGLLALYQSTFDSRWYLWARDLVEIIAIQFSDRQEGGFFDTSEDHESLVYRPKDVQDNATPSGSAAAANVLLQVSLLSGDRQHWDYAVDAVSRQGSLAVQYPTGFAHWLCAADLILSDPVEVAIAGEPNASDARELIDLVFDRYRPNLVVAVGADEKNVPLLIGREQVNNRAAAYVCRQFTCKLPVTNPSDLRSLLP